MMSKSYAPLALVGVTVLWYLVKSRGNANTKDKGKTIGEGSAATNPPATKKGGTRLPTNNFLLDLLKKDTEFGVCQWENCVLNPSDLQYTFKSFVGQSELIHDTLRAVLLYLKKPSEFPDAPRILLYGPSGSGKSMLAEAIVNDLGITCYKVDITTYK